MGTPRRKPKRKPLTLPQFRRRILLLIGMALTVLFGVYRVSRPHPPLKSPPVAPPVVEETLPDPPGIILHHSNTPGRVHGKLVDAKLLDHIHQDDHPGWAIVYKGKTYHIGYHYVILANGEIQAGRPEHCQGAHCPKHNNCIGICLVGAFSTVDPSSWKPRVPTKPQMASLLMLCEKLMSKYHIPPENVRRHRDLRMTWCPGGRFPYDQVIHDLRIYADAHPEVRIGARPMTATTSPPPPKT
jgi:hypothetical protein